MSVLEGFMKDVIDDCFSGVLGPCVLPKFVWEVFIKELSGGICHG